MTLFPKVESRKRIKGRASRHERAVIRDVRQQTVTRDGYCRLYVGDAALRARLVVMFGPCNGPSEWSHFNETHRRSKTVGQAPKERHQRRFSLMLCAWHADEYDEHRMNIDALTDACCDGRLRFSRNVNVWEEAA